MQHTTVTPIATGAHPQIRSKPRLPLAPLVVRYGRLGDMVLQAPLLHLLHRRYGLPCRLLGAGDWPAPLFAASQDVSDILQLSSKHTPLALSPQRWRLVNLLRGNAGPVYVTEDMPRDIGKIRTLLALAGIAPERTLFLNDMERQCNEHWVDRLLRLGRLTPPAFDADDYRFTPQDFQFAPRLRVRPADCIDRDGWLRQRGLIGRPIVLLQIGNKRAIKRGTPRRDDPKAWPIHSWIELLHEMHQRLPSAALLLCGSPKEFALLETLRKAAGLAAVETAAKDLPLGRLLGLCEIAHSMVSVDSGPAHVAAATGCPLVVLYGAETPLLWNRRSPFGNPVINVGGPPHTTCVGDIRVAQVIDAWQEVLRWHECKPTSQTAGNDVVFAAGNRTG